MNEFLKKWIEVAEQVIKTCQNPDEFKKLIEEQKLRSEHVGMCSSLPTKGMGSDSPTPHQK